MDGLRKGFGAAVSSVRQEADHSQAAGKCIHPAPASPCLAEPACAFALQPARPDPVAIEATKTETTLCMTVDALCLVLQLPLLQSLLEGRPLAGLPKTWTLSEHLVACLVTAVVQKLFACISQSAGPRGLSFSLNQLDRAMVMTSKEAMLPLSVLPAFLDGTLQKKKFDDHC